MIFSLLAEAPMPAPSPEDLFSWLKVAAMLAGLYLLALKIVEHHTAKPPMDKQIEMLRKEVGTLVDLKVATLATKDEVERIADAMTEKVEDREVVALEFRRVLHQDIKELDKKLSQRTGEIFDAIRSLGREISHVEGRISKTQKITVIQEPR